MQKSKASLVTVSALFAIAAIWSSASAQPLKYDQIIETIPGKWMVPHEKDGVQVADCSSLSITIWLTEEDGNLVYYSQFHSSDGEGYEPKIRSVVRRSLSKNGRELPAIELQYDDEDRLTEAGELVRWRLLMPDKDTFTWQATHWTGFSTTPFRTRCPGTEAIS